MSAPIKTLLTFSLSLFLFSSCKKSSDNKSAADNSKPTFMKEYNGFEYVGSFEEADAPDYYQYPWVAHIDDYLDNDRVVVTSEKAPWNPPALFKWYILNFNGGKLTSTHSTKDGFGDDRGDKFQYVFEHETFKLKTWHNTGKYYWELAKDGKENVYIVSAGSQFNAKLIDNHLLRIISEVRWWPYNTTNMLDEAQFLLTGEQSAMKVIDYYFDNTYETEHENSIYTGYFYPSNDGNWIGVSKGNTRLDSVLISKESPVVYLLGYCQTFIEKVGNKLILAFIKNDYTANNAQNLSMYELTIGENILRPLFLDKPLPLNGDYSISAIRNGKLYFFPTLNAKDQTPYTIDKTGNKTSFQMPVFAEGVGVQSSRFGKKYWYYVLSKDQKRIEIYKKNLFQ